jgi:F420-dependent oxidoreductase-like protein
MQLRIFTEPQQGAAYEDLLAVARATELAGFDAFFRSDHYLKMGDVSGLPGPTHAWVTLAGLARDTARIRLGTLVSPVTFYQPGPLAITVAQVDTMSGGRVELGIGAGWYEAEHHAYGLPFPPTGERMDRLEECLEQVTGLWSTPDGERFEHDGRFHTFADSPALPKPDQRPAPPIIIGGRGPRRTPRLVARFASEYNVPFASVDDVAAAGRRVRQACDEVGRDPDELVYSAALVVCCGADEAEVKRRAAAIGREPDELRRNGAAGTVDEVVATLGRYGEIGITRVYLQVLDLSDLAHLELLGAEVLPAVR